MKLTKEAVKQYLQNLPSQERIALLSSLDILSKSTPVIKLSRRELLNNKQGECPHCGHVRYVKFGV